MTTVTVSPRFAGVTGPMAKQSTMQSQQPIPQVANPAPKADTVQFSGKFAKGAAIGTAVLVGGTGIAAHQLFTNWGFWWDHGGEKIAEYVINNAVRYPLGNGIVDVKEFLPGYGDHDTAYYTLLGMRVEGSLSDSQNGGTAFGGYADFVPEVGTNYDHPEQKMLRFIQNSPLENRIYLDPADEKMVNTIKDPQERLSIELNVLDGTIQTVDYKDKQQLVLAIQDQTGQRGDYAVYIKQIPADVATVSNIKDPATLEKAKQWSRQAIVNYKSVNADPGGKEKVSEQSDTSVKDWFMNLTGGNDGGKG